MITVLLFIVVAILIIGFISLYISFQSKMARLKDDSSLGYIKQDLESLNQTLSKTQEAMHERIDRNNNSMQTSMHKQMSESARLITEVTNRLTKLDETNRRVVDVADELKTLQNVLSNPKQRGVLGEYYLNQVLENVLPPDRFKLQYKICKDEQGRDLICDAVIILDKGRMLPVDSKFSLENYNRL